MKFSIAWIQRRVHSRISLLRNIREFSSPAQLTKLRVFANKTTLKSRGLFSKILPCQNQWSTDYSQFRSRKFEVANYTTKSRILSTEDAGGSPSYAEPNEPTELSHQSSSLEDVLFAKNLKHPNRMFKINMPYNPRINREPEKPVYGEYRFTLVVDASFLKQEGSKKINVGIGIVLLDRHVPVVAIGMQFIDVVKSSGEAELMAMTYGLHILRTYRVDKALVVTDHESNRDLIYGTSTTQNTILEGYINEIRTLKGDIKIVHKTRDSVRLPDHIAQIHQEGKKFEISAILEGEAAKEYKAMISSIFPNKNNSIIYSNRSAAYASAGDDLNALYDAEKAVDLNPDWARAFSRLGAAYLVLWRCNAAIKAYQKGVDIDPTDITLNSGLSTARFGMKYGEAKAFANLYSDKNLLWNKLSANPTTKDYKRQQDFVTMINKILKNPKTLKKQVHKQPRLRNALHVLLETKIDIEPPDDMKLLSHKAQEKLKLGNAAYINGNFYAAINYYGEAIELNDAAFLIYRAKIFLKDMKLDEAITDCETALDLLAKYKTDSEMEAHALALKQHANELKAEEKG